MCRSQWRWGRKYTYTPRIDLLERLADETGMSIDEVRTQLQNEREFILKNPYYYHP